MSVPTLLAEGHIQTMLVVRVRVIMAFGQRRTFLVPDSWGDAPGYGENRPSAKKRTLRPGEQFASLELPVGQRGGRTRVRPGGAVLRIMDVIFYNPIALSGPEGPTLPEGE